MHVFIPLLIFYTCVAKNLFPEEGHYPVLLMCGKYNVSIVVIIVI